MPPASAFRHPVSQYGSGTGLSPLLPVPHWFRHQHFYSFRYRTYLMPDISALINNTPCMCTLLAIDPERSQCWLVEGAPLMLKNHKYKCRNAREKSSSGIGSFTGSQLLQSGTCIPAGSVRHRWSRISPALPSYAISYAFLLGCMIRPNILEKFDHFILIITVFK